MEKLLATFSGFHQTLFRFLTARNPQQLFSQLIAFLTAYSTQQLFFTATTQPNKLVTSKL
jgi:hypothetical protein